MRQIEIKAMCFDLDGTLIRDIDSVQFLCFLNGNLAECERIQRLEDEGSTSWIEADFLKARLIKDLELSRAESSFKRELRPIQGIERVMSYLDDAEIKSLLLTSGPVQVAAMFGREYGFDYVYGSKYGVLNNRFDGTILTHLDSDGKLCHLKEYCEMNGFGLGQCVAIGNSDSDIAVFSECWKSIAINYADSLKGKASAYLITDDLYDVIEIIESWLVQKADLN